MKKTGFILLSVLCSMTAQAYDISDKKTSLTETLVALDSGVFESFNQCSSAKALKKHADYFASDVEFYHDNGGVTWDRDSMISNTKKNACGNYTRELVAGTFKAYPIKGFGAISQGVHRFCQVKTKKCEGKAEFVMIWRKTDAKWEITRVLSYGHRVNR